MDRIPTAQIKRVMQKGKKVMIKVEKHIRKVVPQSSKLHVYLSRKSSALLQNPKGKGPGNELVCYYWSQKWGDMVPGVPCIDRGNWDQSATARVAMWSLFVNNIIY